MDELPQLVADRIEHLVTKLAKERTGDQAKSLELIALLLWQRSISHQ